VKQKFGLHHYFGLRAVAIVELVKGAAVLLIGMGLLSLVHRDVEEAVQRVLRTLHFDPTWGWCQFLLTKASTVRDLELRRLAVVAFAYAAFRFVEAYGLWFEYLWAEWLAVIAATIPLPWEIDHLILRPSIAKVCMLLANLLIVAYLAYVLWDSHRARVTAMAAAAAGTTPGPRPQPAPKSL